MRMTSLGGPMIPLTFMPQVQAGDPGLASGWHNMAKLKWFHRHNQAP